MPSDPEYRVVYHRVTHQQLKSCFDALRAAGWEKAALVEILASAERRLKKEPSSCGEPLFTLRPQELLITAFCFRPFNMHFGIHEETRTVFVREIAFMTLDKP